MQKLLSFATILAVLSFGAVAAYALGTVEPVSSDAPHVSSAVEADPLPPTLDAPRVQNASPIVIVGSAPKRAKVAKVEKRWTCGAFRALENDAVQTVADCRWQ